MSFANKIVTTYAKSLFRNVLTFQTSKTKNNVSKSGKKGFAPTVFIIGEELILIRSVLVSSKKLTDFFKNPTYREQQKLDIILSIFPGLTITMKSFLKVLTERNHLSLLPEISETYTELLLKFKEISKVKLITASALAKPMGPRLLHTLRKLTNTKEIILTFSNAFFS